MDESSQPGAVAQLRGTLTALQWQARRELLMTDEQTSELLSQVIALEEVLAARWPRSILVRARWRRDVRASVRYIDGSTFTERRGNTIGTGWLSR